MSHLYNSNHCCFHFFDKADPPPIVLNVVSCVSQASWNGPKERELKAQVRETIYLNLYSLNEGHRKHQDTYGELNPPPVSVVFAFAATTAFTGKDDDGKKKLLIHLAKRGATSRWPETLLKAE